MTASWKRVPFAALLRAFWLCGLAAAAHTHGAASAHAQAVNVTARGWQPWHQAVTNHVPGRRDHAVTSLAQWSHGDLEAVLPRLDRQTPDEQLAVIARAVVLHADVAALHRTAEGYNLPPGSSPTTLFQDGHAMGHMFGTYHWEFARQLLDRAPRGEERQRIGRLFYRATAALLQRWGEYPEFERHLLAARRLLGDDAVLLLYEGTLHQAYAAPRVQRFFDEQNLNARSTRSWSPSPFGEPAFPSVNASRSRAERLFRRALGIDPLLVEARIRLAHVLSDRGRTAEAAAELERARAAPLPRALDYYAWLMAGRVARTQGELDDAQRSYERAAELYPEAPAADYGLSDVAMARDNRPQALAHLLEASARARVEEHEPWWWLDRGHAPSALDQVSEMWRGLIK